MRVLLGILLLALTMFSLTLENPALAEISPTKGEVTKIDERAGKITLRHEPIRHLDMDSMTMVFRVTDPAMLKTVAVGDKVVFEVDRVNGALTIMGIRKEE